MRELIPAVKKLWAGDYAHDGRVLAVPEDHLGAEADAAAAPADLGGSARSEQP